MNLESRVKDWVRKNRLEAFILASILLLGAFFRLYRIDEYMTFLGDEGRDVIVVRRLLVNLDPILIGPGTSIGDMYLGPIYYYMMAPALLLANFSPAGPAVMIALLGIVTTFFLWQVAREWFGKLAAFVATALYAVSPVIITYSRSSWNPNIMPFFSLLTIYSVWDLWQKHEFKWLIVMGTSMAFVLQSHYLGLLLVPTIILFWLLTFLKIRGKEQELKFLIKHSLIAFGIFLVLMSPLLIFDLRHNWMNFNAMKHFFTERQTTVSARPWTSFPKLPKVFTRVVTNLVAGKSERVGIPVTMLYALGIVWAISTRFVIGVKRKKNVKFGSAYLLLFVWIGVALVGLGVYKQEVYDHYYGFFFTAPFLLAGGLAEDIARATRSKSVFLKAPVYILLIFAFTILVIVNLKNNPLKYPPNRQLQRTIEVSEKIIQESKGEKFNLAVIAERNYEGAYQYFLERWHAPLVIIDPTMTTSTITDRLFVVCELPDEKCDPTHNPKAEVANFGWSKIDGKWEVAGVTLYKLTHTP